jgi:hypothetical protein
MEPKAYEAYAQLCLEESAPFPVEQLAWGFLPNKEATHLLVLACPRKQLPAHHREAWESAPRVLPEDAVLAQLNLEALYVWCSGMLTLIQYSSQTGFPLPRLFHAPLPASATVTEQTEARERLRLQAHLKAVPALVTLGQGVVGRNGDVQVHVTTEQQPKSVHLSEAISWSADLRDSAWLARLRKQQRLGAHLWRGLLVAAGICLLLVVLSLLTLGLEQWNQRLQTEVAERALAVEAIVNNQVQIEKLNTFIGEPFEPFAILEAINVLRPKADIWFDTAAITDDGDVRIRGYAQRVNQVNAFNASLLGSGQFSEVEDIDFQPRAGGKVEFRMHLKYTQAANPEASPSETTPGQAPAAS